MLSLPVYQSVFASSPVGECLLTPDGTILDVNQTFLQTTLRGREELIASSVFDAFAVGSGDSRDADAAGFRESLARVAATGQPEVLPLQRYPVMSAAPDGSRRREERFWSCVNTPIFAPDGRLACIAYRALDVTDLLRERSGRQAFQLELADRLRSLEAADDIVAAASELLGQRLNVSRVVYCEIDDANGTFFVRRDWNNPGHGLRSIAGAARSLDDFGPRVVAMLRAGQVVRNDDVRVDPLTAQHTSAYERIGIRAALSISLGKAGRMTVVLSLQDVKPRHWTDEDVDKCQETAERTWAAVEKASAQAELQEANRRKDEFLAMLAHELRNPLAPISAAARLMEMGQLEPERLKETSRVITRQVAHMTGLVDDLLDMSRVTRGLVVLHNKPQDIQNIVSNAAEQARPLVESQRHQFTIEAPGEPVYVMGDANRLVQIVTNLLTNAAKYTPPGGQISVRIKSQETQVVLHVADNGIGIAPDLQHRVFDLFAQAERTPDRSQGGLGLGLALVKSLVELHGGEVVCRSEGLGKGCCFSVYLPRLTPYEAPRERRGADRALRPVARLKVLVVDDNADAAEMLALLLQTSGHEVTVEHEGAAGLEAARQTAPDVCLLDIGLPDMDGKDLAQRLRAQRESEGAVLIAITGYGQEQDRQSAFAAGFDHHLVKPVDPDKLAALLNRVAKAA